MIPILCVVGILNVIGTTICVLILLDMQAERREKMEILRVVKEWVLHGKEIRQDVRDDASKVSRKADQLAQAVQNVPERTADRVVERIAGNSGITAHPPAEPPPLGT